MALALGTRIGPYEVLAPLGAGGMGEVYRARDTKLGRDVAIKVLPETLGNDPGRLARFEREAKTLAALNHPNIAHIHGFEDSTGAPALVMELVEGPTLADRIARGPIPIDEALPIARQIAEGLEAAHEHGIIHRDLKPANIKVKNDNTVKVLDFGLAKALDATTASNPSVTQSPTITTPAMMTGVGMILGTAAYMSPEQARGRPVDKRADIWAFGVVLFEMLTRTRAFKGDDVSTMLASILKSDPDWTALPPTTPAALRRLLTRCLKKDSNDRLRDIGDARIEIANILHHATDEPVARVTIGSAWTRRIVPWTAAAIGIVATATMFVLWAPWRRPPSLAVTRVSAATGADVSLVAGYQTAGAVMAISPDGALLAFVAPKAGFSGVSQLYARRLDQLKATPMSGTDDATSPFFSPDGQWLAFFAAGKLKKISVAGGVALAVCDAPNSRGGTWADDGNIVFQPSGTAGGRLMRVSSSGGEPQPLTALSEGEVTQRWPQVLPGGRAVLFTSATTTGNYANASVVAQPLPDGPRKILVRGGFFARYLASGHLVYVYDNTLYAASFDSSRLELTSQPAPVVEDVNASLGNGSAQFAVSNTGTLVYLSGPGETNDAPIVWIDRSGKRTPIRRTPTNWSNLQFSPDGQRVAMDISDGGQSDIWVYDWTRDTMTRLTLGPGDHRMPLWTPDGRRIAFRWDEPGKPPSVSWRRADGGGDVQQLLAGPVFPGSWHPSGKSLAVLQLNAMTSYDVMILPMEGNDVAGWRPGNLSPVVNTVFPEFAPAFSPDGHWIAYQSNESGRLQIYVRPFPAVGGKWQISTDGGTFPVWSRTRKELLYAAPDNRILVVSYSTQGDSFAADKPRLWPDAVFLARSRGLGGAGGRPFDLHPDGERVAIAPASENHPSDQQDKLVFVFSFFDELRRIALVKK